MRNFFIFFGSIFLVSSFACSKNEKTSLGSCDNGLYHTEYTGNATWYNAEGGGNCMIEYPSDKMYGAMNKAQYDNSNACGAYVKITNEKNNNQVVVQILDQCPECDYGHIDLSPEAFAKLAPLSDGITPIKWEYIKSPEDKNMSIRFKEGSNPWWTAVQVINPRYMVLSIEAKNQNNEFVALERQSYNYFLDPDGIKNGEEGPYELRITDVNGHSVTGTYELAPGVIIPTGQQFDECN